MNKLSTLLVTLGLAALASCGGNNNKTPDAPPGIDAPTPDAPPSIPNPPTLGAEIDRMGRPAINTALNHVFDVDTTTKNAAKNAYNADGGTGSWGGTYGAEFAKNLALLDSLDSTSGATGTNGCGNQILYNGNLQGGGTAGSASYATLASVLADDQLYLNTSTGTCGAYLGVELEYLGVHAGDCGGRTLTEDVIDVSYSALAAGVAGFDQSLNPLVKDGVSAHADVSQMFPYLGAPH